MAEMLSWERVHRIRTRGWVSNLEREAVCDMALAWLEAQEEDAPHRALQEALREPSSARDEALRALEPLLMSAADGGENTVADFEAGETIREALGASGWVELTGEVMETEKEPWLFLYVEPKDMQPGPVRVLIQRVEKSS